MVNPGPSWWSHGFMTHMQGAWVLSLVWEVRYHTPCSAAKKKKKDMVNSIIGISEIMRKFHVYPSSPYSLMASHGYPSFQALGKQS